MPRGSGSRPLFERAPVLPRASWLWTPSPCSGRLQCCHVPRGFGPRLPAQESFGAAMCPMAPDSTSLLRGLWCCHVSRGSGPRLPAREGSNTVTCPAALDLASLFGRVLALPRVPWLRTPPPCSGGLRRCHMSRSSQRAMSLRNEERTSLHRHAAGLVCFQDTQLGSRVSKVRLRISKARS
jgi:hypothetical protein